ncbi:universal stress protein [Nonomuraea jiangxiensis]|uniref:Nucleotide-binding universal stress protein, UspA family n=1 Tax=Nonomuraea jiangxiensis TaxID=633440 RepID=A0A1G9MIK8_9ACTN|nr:universal stress protein [Nonomuraea jiangxiensis]SDL73923.1 Nucleotide-binding universal stress protein, UspA family [Nonomuraea jiangxiensis]
MNDTLGVVIGYDGSDHSMQALDWAMDEAELRTLPLTVCHAWHWPYGEGDQAARDSLQRAAEHVLWHGTDCARASAPGLDVRADLYEGSAAGRLEELSADAELLVVGSRGPGAVARTLTGSVASHAVAHARCPVIVVRGRGSLPRRPHPGPIVAGIADDDKADAVLGFACAEAAMRRLPLIVVHAWHPPPVAWGGVTLPALDPLAVRNAAEDWLTRVLLPWREQNPELAIEARTPHSRAGEALAEVADATLIVVGSPRGRFGSVTATLLRHSPCPVAIVRQEARP